MIQFDEYFSNGLKPPTSWISFGVCVSLGMLYSLLLKRFFFEAQESKIPNVRMDSKGASISWDLLVCDVSFYD